MKKYILDDNGYYLGITENENVTHTKIEEELPELTDIQTAKWDGNQWVVEEDPIKVANKANEWQRIRQMEYPSIQDQLDMQYHDLVDGTTTWKDAVAKVKADNPKPEST